MWKSTFDRDAHLCPFLSESKQTKVIVTCSYKGGEIFHDSAGEPKTASAKPFKSSICGFRHTSEEQGSELWFEKKKKRSQDTWVQWIWLLSAALLFPLKLRQINCAVQWLFYTKYKPPEICKRENYGSADMHSLQKILFCIIFYWKSRQKYYLNIKKIYSRSNMVWCDACFRKHILKVYFSYLSGKKVLSNFKQTKCIVVRFMHTICKHYFSMQRNITKHKIFSENKCYLMAINEYCVRDV